MDFVLELRKVDNVGKKGFTQRIGKKNHLCLIKAYIGKSTYSANNAPKY